MFPNSPLQSQNPTFCSCRGPTLGSVRHPHHGEQPMPFLACKGAAHTWHTYTHADKTPIHRKGDKCKTKNP